MARPNGGRGDSATGGPSFHYCKGAPAVILLVGGEGGVLWSSVALRVAVVASACLSWPKEEPLDAGASDAAAGPVRFLLNPAAGGWGAAARLDRVRVLASAAGAGFVVSKSGADIVEQARRAVADGVARLVVAGGDGTMHQAAQGLAGSGC